LEINGEQYVAKELVDIGEGRCKVPAESAARFLVSDLVRLKRMDHFQRLFKALAIQKGVQIESE
jgi:hypothetical protein